MEKTKIVSLKALARHLTFIIESISASPRLALAVAQNPVQAIEQLGFKLSPGMRAEIVGRILFQRESALKISDLGYRILQLATHPCTEKARTDLHQQLFESLKIALAPTPFSETSSPAWLRTLPERGFLGEPLKEIYCLDKYSPAIAELEMYRKIRNGTIPARNRGNGSDKEDLP